MRQKTIMIRADGNARIGAGHLMRCLTIADVGEDKTQVKFVCADEESAALAREKGYEAYVLHTDYRNMEAELPVWENLPGMRFAEDKVDTGDVQAKALKTRPQEYVILVDSYYVTNAYLSGLKRFGTVVLLDDMAKEPQDADILINYNVFADQEMYRALESPFVTQYYTGGDYVPVRKEFCSGGYVLREKAEHVLITTGGGDCDNIGGRILEKIWSKNCTYHVVTGRFNPHYDKLTEQAQKHDNIHIYHNVKNMADLMKGCDLAVTAGGTTVYELCAVGVPFVCFSYAANQEKLTEYIGEHHIAGYGGAFHKKPAETLEEIRRKIERLTDDRQLRSSYSLAEKKLVDGMGAARIRKILS